MNEIVNIENYLRINLVDMGLVLISTFLIVVFAKKFFWSNAKAYLDGRQQHIQEELETSQENLQASETMRNQYESQIANVNSEASEIISSAKRTAKAEAGDIVNDAKHSAEIIKEKAQKDIERDKLNARKQMREEMSDIAFLAAKKVVEKELDEDVHKKYVKDFIDQVDEDESWQA